MTDNVIKLNKSNTLKLEIITDKDEKTGEYLEFDLEDVDLLLKYQEMIEQEKKNREHIKNQLIIIDKREDVKGKKLLSRNEEDKIKAIKEFYNKEIEVYNMFLGKNGVQKLLNGRKITWTIFDEINDIIEKQIAPKLNINMKTIADKIKSKYKISQEEEILK